MSEIGELVKRNDLNGLMKLFHLTDWDGKESVIVGIRYIFHTGKHNREKMIESLEVVLKYCGSESHSYANNCRHEAKKMLMKLGCIKLPIDNKAKRNELSQILKSEKHTMFYNQIKALPKGILQAFRCSSGACAKTYSFHKLPLLTEAGFLCESCGSPLEVYESYVSGNITYGMFQWMKDYITGNLSMNFKPYYNNSTVFFKEPF